MLAIALVSWMWPVATLCVAALAPRSRRELDDVSLLDPRSGRDRVSGAWRRDWRALAVAAVVMAVALCGETTAFDVARVLTAASELRLLDAAGADATTLWSVASVPAGLTLGLAAIAVAASVRSAYAVTSTGVSGWSAFHCSASAR